MGRRDRGRLRLGRSRRRDRLGRLTANVLRALVLEVNPQDVRAPAVFQCVGERHEGQIFLPLRVDHLVHARQVVSHQRTERPVDRRRCRLGPLVLEYVQERIDEFCVGLVVRCDELRLLCVLARSRHDVRARGADLEGLPAPHVGGRLPEEAAEPGVGVGDVEVADRGVAERLRVGVTEGWVHTDLGGELLELRVLVLVGGDERR